MTGDDALMQARQHARAGDMLSAERLFRVALSTTPAALEALLFIANACAARGEYKTGVQLFQRAMDAAPGDAALLLNYGIFCQMAGELMEAKSALERACKAATHKHLAWLYLGLVHEQLAQTDTHQYCYFNAMTAAQANGEWMSDASTAPWLRKKVKHAAQIAGKARWSFLAQSLEPIRQSFGTETLKRVEKCLQGYLGMMPVIFADPMQRPTFLYIPDMPAAPILDLSLFPWLEELERHTAIIKQEMLSVLYAENSLKPFHENVSESEMSRLLSCDKGAPQWDAFFFYRRGQRIEANCQRCPKTDALLRKLPLDYVRDHSPEICFSVLKAGTHILPHRGVTNARVVVHLPLLIPQECALHVTGQPPHVWNEGQCFIFDDTYEHEAWNRSDGTRVILLFDVWSPHLSVAEQQGIARLVEAIGDFRTRCESIVN